MEGMKALPTNGILCIRSSDAGGRGNTQGGGPPGGKKTWPPRNLKTDILSKI